MLEFHSSEFPTTQMLVGIDGDAQKDSWGSQVSEAR
jgi:hypothetical protein